MVNDQHKPKDNQMLTYRYRDCLVLQILLEPVREFHQKITGLEATEIRDGRYSDGLGIHGDIFSLKSKIWIFTRALDHLKSMLYRGTPIIIEDSIQACIHLGDITKRMGWPVIPLDRFVECKDFSRIMCMLDLDCEAWNEIPWKTFLPNET